MISFRSFISVTCGIMVLMTVVLTPACQESCYAASGKAARIRIVFSVVDEHSELLITSESKLGPYKTFYLTDPNRLVLDIKNAELPEGFLTMPVDREELKDIRVAEHDNMVRFVFDFPENLNIEHSVESVEEGLKVTLMKKGEGTASAVEQPEVQSEVQPEKPAMAQKPAPPAPSIRKKSRKTESAPSTTLTQKIEPPQEETSAPAPTLAAIQKPDQDSSAIVLEKTYTGRKINVRLFKADVKEFFEIISAASGEPIEVPPDIHREITLRLSEVPWDQAVDLVSKFYGLKLDRNSKMWRVTVVDQK